MDWKDIGKRISDAAPMLGGILGGPAGAAAGVGIKLLASLFGLSENETTPEKINELLATDPQALIKIKQMEYENQADIRRYYLQVMTAHLQDVANARAREVEITKTTGKRDINLYILAWLVVGLFFTLVGILIWATLPETNIGPVNQLFGAMAAGFGMVLTYFFGSSKSSADKNQLLAAKTP